MLSIFNWFGYREVNHAEGFRLIKQAGFEGVLLWWDFAERGEDYRKQPELARREGLWIENIHTNFEQSNHLWEDTQEGQAVYKYYLQCVEDCAAFEIPTMVVHPSYSFGALPPTSPLGLDRLQRVVDRAEQKGINIAMENMLRPEAIARAAWLLEQIESPRFGLCFDSGHHHARFVQTPETDLLARFGHRLMALHLHDNHGQSTSSDHPDEHLLSFDGTIDWAALMRKIAETGYQGPTTLEVENKGHEETPPEEFLALAYERAVKLEQLRKV